MKKQIYTSFLSIVLAFSVIGIGTYTNISNAAPAKTKVKTETVVTKPNKPVTTNAPAVKQEYNYISVKPIVLVDSPKEYLNKRVRITARFDKFSSLGLDYKPAMRSSEKYITFLIMRDDVDHNIPLSELKNFLKREVAEKNITLETGDIIEYKGLVFSNALGDVWLDVEDFKVISAKKKSNKTENTVKK